LQFLGGRYLQAAFLSFVHCVLAFLSATGSQWIYWMPDASNRVWFSKEARTVSAVLGLCYFFPRFFVLLANIAPASLG
jgi:hypothetical protein